MAGLAAGLAWATVVTPGWSAIGFGLVIGAAANAARAIEAASTPRLFGTAHLGSIRAVVSALNIGSTAFGPLAFATVRDVTGSYAFALLGGILLPVAVAIAALLTPLPSAVAARRRSESG
nr:hypothetical protein [Micromonospora sp. Llam0]